MTLTTVTARNLLTILIATATRNLLTTLIVIAARKILTILIVIAVRNLLMTLIVTAARNLLTTVITNNTNTILVEPVAVENNLYRRCFTSFFYKTTGTTSLPSRKSLKIIPSYSIKYNTCALHILN